MTEVAPLTGGGADADDAAAPVLFAQVQHRFADGGERSSQMHADDGVEVVVAHLPQHRVAQHAGVGDQDVEASEVVDRCRDDCFAVSVEPTGATTATAWPPAAS